MSLYRRVNDIVDRLRQLSFIRLLRRRSGGVFRFWQVGHESIDGRSERLLIWKSTTSQADRARVRLQFLVHVMSSETVSLIFVL